MSSAEARVLEARALQYLDHSLEFKASIIAAIEANGGNVSATAKLFNISRDTAYYWWRNSDRYCEIQTPCALNLADKLENIAHNTADSIADHDLSIVSYRDKGAVLSTVIDKMQLLRGLPTNITENIERQELTVILAGALESAIDVTPEQPESRCITDGTV